MIDYDEIETLLDHLADHPHQFHALIADVDDATLRRASPGGQWGAVEIFCHLRDLEDLFIERVTRILTEDNPHYIDVDETLWPIERDYASQQPRKALDAFCKRREQFVRILAPLDAIQWHRFGTHQGQGRQSVLWYAQHAVQHDSTHLEQLREVLDWHQTHRAAASGGAEVARATGAGVGTKGAPD